MNREEPGTERKSDADQANRQESDQQDEQDEPAAGTEPGTPLIDQDFAGSVNAALHDTDE